MVGRLLATITLLLLALGAFWGDALGEGYIVGAVFVCLSAATWVKWEAIRQAFRSAKDESDIPIIRLTSKAIGGMFRQEPLRRRSPSN
ncbi:MAG: hypothetical protein JO162_02070 [Alphaproteobacteria bacterium]|nr:hypothetical protein [Alphaproteobacteria bacterium]MBV9153785.1 hypothetical protein [Alphaproteobacteria bacterium]